MASILVVDDEMGIRELLNEILTDEGHTVIAAENAEEARRARDNLDPDLVLLDIWMPDIDGVTLLKEWSTNGKLTMPVVMMSGHATIDSAVEATRIGAINFLEKPIALQKLLKTVEAALEKAPPKEFREPPASLDLKEKPINEVAKIEKVDSTRPASSFDTTYVDLPLREARDLFEKAYFEYHLAQAQGSMTRVSERTGLERTHLYRKLKTLGIDVSAYKAE